MYEFKPKGAHVLGEIYGEEIKHLNDPEKLVEILEKAAKETGATVLYSYYHQFSPQGVTAFCVLSESHISIHTYPDYNMACYDVFTCGEHTDPEAAVEILVKELNAQVNTYRLMDRGWENLELAELG